MHILIVHNTVIPVKEYGGIERVVWWLGKELHKKGHKVTYLVPDGSSCPFGDILVLNPELSINEQIPETVDFVHLHFQVKEKIKKPYLISYHCNYHDEDNFDINTVFSSLNHAQRHKAQIFVHNGMDLDDYGAVDWNIKRKHLLFFAYAKRPEKNLKDCIEIARKSGEKLAIIGGKFKFYKWRPWADYRGFLGGKEKNKILNESKALLYPVRWHEPFGVALIEALYYGCPVFGSPYGSLKELIIPEVGLVSDKCQDLIKAVRNIGEFNSKRCHEYVCDKFTSKVMTERYLELYDRVLNGQSLNEQLPQNGQNFSRDNLLPMYN